jgi:lipopolysaccharide heptosyltransferase I
VTLPLAGFAVTFRDYFKDEQMASIKAQVAEQPHWRALNGPRILIVRLSAMGDLIHGIPVLNALRKAMPDAMLGWVAEGRNADLLEGHPALDRLIRVPRHWLKSPSAVWALRRKLRMLRFDTTIDLQCLSKSAIAAWLSGAPRRIGYAAELGREVSRCFHNELISVDAEHVIDRYLALLKPLGILGSPVEFNLPERSEDALFVETKLRQLGLEAHGFAIVNPGAGWVSKRWPPDRFGQLARRLAAQHGLATLAVWGGTNELPLAEEIVAHSGGTAQVAPATTMTQLASFARRSAIFVGSDTGPLHLAVAVGARTVSLHGTTRAEQTGAYGLRNRRLQVRYDDSPGRRRHGDDSAMRAIDVEMVLVACSALLGEAQRTPCSA